MGLNSGYEMYEKLEIKITSTPPREAERAFLKTFNLLMKGEICR
jgi:hypothetical protein